MKHTISSLLILTTLTACSLDGEDGQNGLQGPEGAPGQDGNTGQAGRDANAPLSISLVARAVLNAESPEGAAEVVAYQTSQSRVFALNSSGDNAKVVILPLSDIDSAALTKNNQGVITGTNLMASGEIALTEQMQGDANSIAINGDGTLLAVAMSPNKQSRGAVLFYDVSGSVPSFIKAVTVGFLPDMVTFTPDGSKVLVANEGEPLGDYSVDPEGSLSVIEITAGMPANTQTEIGFSALNSQQAELAAQGVVFSNPNGRTINGNQINTTVAMDLEPEYITVSADSKKAYVSLQENNAVAVLDLSDLTVSVKGLGFKAWGDLLFDASDKDGGVNFNQYQNLYGMYQPDTLASMSWQGAHFTLSANEGDGREYFFAAQSAADCTAKGGLDYDEDDGCLAYTDETRAEKLTLGPAFAQWLNNDDDLGRLKVSLELGDADQDGIYEKLYTYGARSFTIWDQNGVPVFDSKDDIDRITAAIHGEAFNNDEDENKGDTRSDAKGAEPEALAVGTIGERTFAFIGLERMSGVMIYDVTNPYNAFFVDYFINRGLVEGDAISGDLAPESMVFIHADHSPTGEPLLVIGNEISGSVAVWQIKQ